MGKQVVRPTCVVALLACSCAQPSSAVERGGGVDPAASVPKVACEPPPAAALVVLQDEPCTWVAGRPDSATVLWKNTDPRTAATFRGALPEPCVRLACEAEARTSPWGPLLVLYAPSAESEMPGRAWLGVPWNGEVVFIDLWAGEDEVVWSDHTPLGPAFSLAPFDCQGQLALFSVARLPAGGKAEPSDGLKAREGRFSGPEPHSSSSSSASEGDLPPPLTDRSRAGCEPVAIPLR